MYHLLAWRWWILGGMIAAYITWKTWRAGRRASAAQRDILAVLAEQIDADRKAAKEIQDNLDIQ